MRNVLFALVAGILFWGCSTSPNNNGGTNTTVIPIAPSNLTGVVVSSSKVNLSWTDNSTNETGFKIERRLDGGNYAMIGTVNSDILNYSDSGLVSNTNYTYRVYSYNAVGNSITYSNEFSISTGGVPVLSTNTIDSISYTTAKSGGNITNDGRSPVTSRGLVWSTSPNPTISLSTKTTDGSGVGTFTSNISGLTPGANYYVRAYATNANGTGYGNELLLITNSYTLPVITTNPMSGITQTAAVSGGNITNDGGAAVTVRGVVWSTSSSPTIALSTKTIDGSGIGSFTSNITGLTANTTYYLRAYAINSLGTSYGGEISFTSTPNVVNLPSVTICNQIWTTKNLDVTTYRNGDAIPQVTDSTQWANLTTGAWCYINNNAANGPIYGKLYNWYAVNDPRGLAPQGWHVPSEVEWTTLETCLGGSSVAGGAMKEAGLMHWLSPNTGATNSSLFTALPGGSRSYIGAFDGLGYFGAWWSSTELSTTTASDRYVDDHSSYLDSYNYNKKNGYSVRCLRD